MFSELSKIPAFIERDIRILTTYKLAFSMQFLNIIFTLFYFIFFGSLFGDSAPAQLSQYGGNFISYLLIGSVGWGFLWSIFNTTAPSLRQEMMSGTLESVTLTTTKILTIMIAYSIFGSIFGFIIIGIITVIGLAFFGIVVFASANIYTLIIFLLSAIMMFGFGLIFAGLTIWLKNIGTTTTLIQSISMIFSGVYFPITVLPHFLQPIGHFLPFYYSIEGLRRSMLPSTSTEELLWYVLILFIFTIIFLILGFFILQKGFIKAKKDGSLIHY